MLNKFFFLILIIIFLFPLRNKAAEKLPVGLFQEDSVKIGLLVRYVLYYQHSSNLEVIFPDSAASYAPFEFVSKNFFPTRTKGQVSTDSAVYIFRTFDITPVQRLQVPVMILQKNDTIVVKPLADSVFLQEMVSITPDNLLTLKSNTQLMEVKERFNYPYVLAGLGIAFLAMLGIWGLFGRKMIINYKLYKLKNDHSAFVSRYNAHIERFNRSQSLQNIEKAITLWKNYLTRLEGSAINSFTTKEIAQFYGQDEDVATALKLFDKAIYGNMLSDESSETIVAFYLLHHFADRRYEFVKDQTRHVSLTR